MGAHPIVLGVCVMPKKLKSMHQLLSLLEQRGEYNIVTWTEDMLLHEPVRRWQGCERLWKRSRVV